MPKAAVNGIDLYYETQGNGETVILVPPNWWPCATWNVGVVPRLSRRYRTLIYDGRGTGRLDVFVSVNYGCIAVTTVSE
jgi:pimeloyl-ACP methyl ester carboxylesterase